MDSFDEIGVLLDADDRSPIVQRFSDALWRFIHGQYNGRGILASRPFRRPTDDFKAETRLEIRPLSDSQVQAFVSQRILGRSEDIVRELFTRRPDLLAAARNPFTCALLLDFVEQQEQPEIRFPASRAEIYEFYTRKRIADAVKYIAHPPSTACSA